jgi:hypothetical protein
MFETLERFISQGHIIRFFWYVLVSGYLGMWVLAWIFAYFLSSNSVTDLGACKGWLIALTIHLFWTVFWTGWMGYYDIMVFTWIVTTDFLPYIVFVCIDLILIFHLNTVYQELRKFWGPARSTSAKV